MGESIRTLRIVGAVVVGLSGLMTFRILRRSLQVLPAALIASSTLVFGYLAYPSSMPTWWNVALGLAAADRLLRYSETGRLRFAAWAGIFVGVGMLIKSTGLYFAFALMLWLLSWEKSHTERWLFLITAGVSTLFFGTIALRTFSLGSVAVVLVPWIVMCMLGWSWIRFRVDPSPGMSDTRLAIGTFAAAATLPVVLFVLPYLLSGNFQALWNGWVAHPSLRFGAASGLLQIYPSAALILLLGLGAVVTAARITSIGTIVLVGAGAGTAYSLINWGGFWTVALTILEYSSVALIAFMGLTHLRRGAIRPEAWLAGCLLAAAAFVQIPFWASVYTMYIAPLAILAAALCLASIADARWLAIGLFVLSIAAGAQMAVGRLTLAAPTQDLAGSIALDVDRGGIRSSADYFFYNELVEHLSKYEGQPIYAGPDSPEVYFLSGALNPSGVFFEVLVPEWDPYSLPLFLEQHQIEAVVLNADRRFAFSEAVPPEIVAEIEKAYPHVTRIGWFVVYEKEARV